MNFRLGKLEVEMYFKGFTPSLNIHWNLSETRANNPHLPTKAWKWEMLLQLSCARSNFNYVLELLDCYPDYDVSIERFSKNLTTVRLLSSQSQQLVQGWLQRQLIRQLSLNASPDDFLTLLQALHHQDKRWTEDMMLWISHQPARWLAIDNGKMLFFSACLYRLNGNEAEAQCALDKAKELIPAKTPYFSAAFIQQDQKK